VSMGVDPALVLVRFGVYGFAILAFGTAAFRLYARAWAKPAPAPLLSVGAPLGLAVCALAYVALLAREAAGAAGAPDLAVIQTLALGTGFGHALTAVAGLAAVVAAMGFANDGVWRRAIAAGVALATLAFIGHAADGQGLLGDARLALMALHLVAVGAWLGALPLLRRALGAGGEVAPMLARFGRIAGWAVAAVLASGAASLAFVAMSAGRPLGPGYVLALAVKLAFVAGLLAVAAVNRLRLTPLARREPARAARALRATILLEQLLGAGAVAAVAWLGQLEPTM